MIRLIALIGVLCFPAMGHTATYWDDPFTAAQNCNWVNGASCLEVGSGVVQLDNTVFQAGNGSAKYVYDFPSVGSCLPGNANFVTDCGGGWTRTITATDTLWRRFWIRLSSSFVVGTPQTKITKAAWTGNNDWLIMLAGGTQLTMANQGFPDAGTTNLLYTTGSLRRGVWECVEIGQTMNTPGVANGLLQIYLNDTVIYNSAVVGWRRTGDTGQFNSIELYRQYGSGTINIDSYAAGNTRIGCGSAPPPGDTTAPTAPSTPTLSVSGAGQINVAWTNGTDAVGVTGTNILRCTGVCTPTVILTTINSGTTTSYADTTVAANTTYTYRLNNFDAAGNQSVYSATAQASTTTKYYSILATDEFTRADNTTLGANWTGGYTTPAATETFGIASNRTIGRSLTVDSIQSYNAIATPNDQYITADLSGYVAANAHPGLLVRASGAPGLLTAYECRIPAPGTTVRIAKWSAGGWTQLASTSVDTMTNTTKIRCEAEGTTIRFYKIVAGVETLLLSTTNADVSAGQAGLIAFSSVSLTAQQFDNVVIGGISTTPPSPPTIASVTSGSRTSTTVTWTGPPTTIRVATQNGSVVEPLASFPSGVYTFPANVLSTMTDWFCLYARDALGVENTTNYVCGTVPFTYDAAEVVLSNPLPSATLPAGTTATQISATLDKTTDVTCRYSTTNVSYAAMQTASVVTIAGMSASASVTGLVTGSNLFYMGCRFTDAVGAIHDTTTNLVITVTVAASTADTTVPSTVSGLVATVLSNSQVELSWAAATDNVAIAGYNVYLSIGSGNTTYVLEAVTSTTTTRIVVNLLPSTVHNFVVKARDTSQNLSAANSNVETVTTQSIPDVTPPDTLTNLRAVGVYANSVILTWDPPVDGQGPATVTIEYCTGVGCSVYQVVASKYALQELIVALSPSTSYSFRALAVDAANNRAAAYSNVVTITTNASGLPVPRLEVPYSTPRLSSGTRLPR